MACYVAFGEVTMTKRPTDHAWDALVEVTGANPEHERGALNRSLSLIKEETAELAVTGEELATMIRYQATLYREVFPTMPLTAPALAKWWGRLQDESERLRALEQEKATELAAKRKRGSNLRAKNDCVTCGGDAWVIVGYTKPSQSQWGIERGIKLQDQARRLGRPADRTVPGVQHRSPGDEALLGQPRLDVRRRAGRGDGDVMTDRQLSWLRTFRGYTEDEAELAAMAADEIERLRAAA